MKTKWIDPHWEERKLPETDPDPSKYNFYPVDDNSHFMEARPIRRYIDSGEFKGTEKSPPHPVHKFMEGLLLDVMFLCAGIGFGYVLWG